jgi:hypothetical protein
MASARVEVITSVQRRRSGCSQLHSLTVRSLLGETFVPARSKRRRTRGSDVQG